MSVSYAYLMGSIELDASNNIIRLEEVATAVNAVVAPGVYYADPTATDFIGTAVATALSNAFAGGNAYTVTLSSLPNVDPAQLSGGFTITRTAGASAFRCRWNSSSFPAHALGFAVEKVAADAVSEVSTKSPSCLWVPNVFHEIANPSASYAGTTQESIANGSTEISRVSQRAKQMVIDLQLVHGRRIFDHVNTADPNASLWSFVDRHGDGRPIRVQASGLIGATTTLQADQTLRLFTPGASGEEWALSSAMAELRPQSARTGLDLWNLSIDLVQRK
jgi:hypothetical protein